MFCVKREWRVCVCVFVCACLCVCVSLSVCMAPISKQTTAPCKLMARYSSVQSYSVSYAKNKPKEDSDLLAVQIFCSFPSGAIHANCIQTTYKKTSKRAFMALTLCASGANTTASEAPMPIRGRFSWQQSARSLQTKKWLHTCKISCKGLSNLVEWLHAYQGLPSMAAICKAIASKEGDTAVQARCPHCYCAGCVYGLHEAAHLILFPTELLMLDWRHTQCICV